MGLKGGFIIMGFDNHESRVDSGDYIGEDGLLYCGKCHTRKQTRIFVPLFNENRVVYSVCDCQLAEQNARKEEQARREQMEHVAALRKVGVGDEKYREMLFSADDGGGDRAAFKVANDYVQNWEAMREKNVGLLFTGEPGTGKTFLAACIANALIDKGYPAMISTVTSLVSAISANYEAKKPEILDQIKSVELLVLDDVGAQRDSKYMAERLFDILDARYCAGKPLIMTTNLGFSEFRNKVSVPREYQRLYDRILELCQPVVVKGGSRRVGIAKSKAEFARELLFER